MSTCSAFDRVSTTSRPKCCVRCLVGLNVLYCNPQEMDALKETFSQLATHNERLEHELAQRDKVMSEQDNVLRVRDQLISALHSRDHKVSCPFSKVSTLRRTAGVSDVLIRAE